MRKKPAKRILATSILLLLVGTGCSTSKPESSCIVNAKSFRDMKKEKANKAWENAQYAISDISDGSYRREQRVLSDNRRDSALEAAERAYSAEIAVCE